MSPFREAMWFLFAVLFLAGNARACTCAGSLPPLKEKPAATAILTGRVLKVTEVDTNPTNPEIFPGYNVTIKVGKVLKGTQVKTVTVFTGTGLGDCGYSFEQGKEYLLYLYGNKSRLETDDCTRTKPLAGAEEEILELEGKLTRIETPPHPPQIVLAGKIADAGYTGYIFQIANYLHDRIFYGPIRAQVFHHGEWHDCAPNQGIDAKTASDPDPRAAADALALERERLRDLESSFHSRGISYLGRMSSARLFAPVQCKAFPWRIGVVYETEPALDSGNLLSRSTTVIWGPRIDPSTRARQLKFEEAFRDTGIVPYSIGDTKEQRSGKD